MDIDDLFDKMKKHFNFDSDMFDMDFFLMPEGSNFNPNDIKEEELKKGYKISYHFEKGMDKPEINIEGDLNNEKLNEYLKKFNLNKLPHGHQYDQLPNSTSIDAGDLSLEPYEADPEEKPLVFEPFAEINDFDNFSEVIIEAPGIEKEDVIITFSNDGKALSFSARNGDRKYFKTIHIPFKSTANSHSLGVNNGIITIKVFKS